MDERQVQQTCLAKIVDDDLRAAKAGARRARKR
jgi:hypothetical protein